VGGGVVAIGNDVLEALTADGEHGEVEVNGEVSLMPPWGVDAGVVVVIVVGVREARFLAALMRTFTVDGIFAIVLHCYRSIEFNIATLMVILSVILISC